MEYCSFTDDIWAYINMVTFQQTYQHDHISTIWYIDVKVHPRGSLQCLLLRRSADPAFEHGTLCNII